ncbi:hypothetical protein [Saccharopolyspora elongata]|uniref:Uncharacterized protein n=1 Tax=Saccharopolyspora elongata TaxID=2530387 RepID=A0A4R4Y7A3_9PSEU|nr:hypothetical protein [Saccharopolyspora elongata]TDD40298.1 hypothetical protein E1288_35805 [Saccharopolyspora elongata]
MLAQSFSPPRPVWIDLDALLFRRESSIRRTNEIPLIARSQGLTLQRVEGRQLGWLRSDRGQWLGVITFTVPTAAGDLSCQLLLADDQFSLRRPDATNPASQSDPAAGGAS